MLRFGHSHLVHQGLPLLSTRAKRKGKAKFLFFGSSQLFLGWFTKSLVAWRPMNIYHGRGLRLAKQQVFRKAGKVSAYR